jgi:beta-glucanase (GH16 family)
VVTGFFLHRDSPRQEIDIEIAGNRTDRLLVNVFYNPGDEGANFDYGYRGAASYIELGFDASESDHKFTIEWEPYEIRWLVDNRLVHSRVEWEPTPIPHLPMALHVNAWPSRSKELAGRLTNRRLPTTTFIRSIALAANRHQG